MPPRNSLKFPVTKKSKRVTLKRKGTKEISYNEEFNNCLHTVGKENKKIKLNDNIDDSSFIDEEMKTIIDVLSSSVITELPERDSQIKTIRSHLNKCINTKESVSLYFCGPSGSGKTAVADFLQSQKDIQNKFTVLYVNCLYHQTDCSGIYREIYGKLGNNIGVEKNMKESAEKLLKTLTSQKKPVLLILDEVLKVSTKNKSVLHSFLKLPSQLHAGQIALITIAHIPNFFIRYMQNVKGKVFEKPIMIEFPPYNNQDIVNIIKKRLNQITLRNIIIEPSAIELLGRKASADRSDARKALELTKKVIEACIVKNSKEGVCNIQPIDVQIITTDILEHTEKFDRLNHLPLHQKLILCAVLSLIRDSKFDRTKLNISVIEGMYRKICENQKIEGCRSDEFLNLCSLVALTGVFSISGKKPERSSKVTIEWNEDVIKSRFSDKCFFGAILNS